MGSRDAVHLCHHTSTSPTNPSSDHKPNSRLGNHPAPSPGAAGSHYRHRGARGSLLQPQLDPRPSSWPVSHSRHYIYVHYTRHYTRACAHACPLSDCASHSRHRGTARTACGWCGRCRVGSMAGLRGRVGMSRLDVLTFERQLQDGVKGMLGA